MVESKVRVGLIQSHWRSTPEANLEYILGVVDEIGRRGDTQIIALPEFFMGPPFYFPGMVGLKGIVDDTIPGRVTDMLGELARKHGTYILGGTLVERQGEEYYNASFVLDDDGQLVGHTHKVHCFSAELVTVKPGNDQLIVDTPFGHLGVCICSDFWIPEMPRMLALKGAEIIYVSGSSLAQNIDLVRPCVLACSVHNVCYTVYTSVVGKVVGRRANDATFSIEMAGHTTVASPESIVGTLDNEEDVLFADLDMEHLRELRKVDVKFKNTLFWGLWGRRPELYGDITKPYVEAKEDLKSLLEEYLAR